MGRMRSLLLACLMALTLMVACAPYERPWPTSTATEFFPQEPYQILAREIQRGSGAGRLRKLIATGMDLNQISVPARVPGSIKPKTITLLQWAVMSDNADAVQVLLEGGADPSRVPDAKDKSPLHLAVLRQDERMMRLLLESGADVKTLATSPSIYDNTPLMYLFQADEVTTRTIRGRSEPLSPAQRADRAEILLRAGSDVNQVLARWPKLPPTDPRGSRPIHNLTSEGNWLGVLWLLEHGADPRARDVAGCTLPCIIRSDLRRMRGYRNPASAPADPAKRWHLAADSPMQQVLNWMIGHGFAPDEFDPDKHPDRMGCSDPDLRN